MDPLVLLFCRQLVRAEVEALTLGFFPSDECCSLFQTELIGSMLCGHELLLTDLSRRGPIRGEYSLPAAREVT
jgi:hypothetical protein